MRITNKLMTENAIQYMEENMARLYALQTKTASGKQYLVASDNPTLAAHGLNLRSTMESGQGYLDTAQMTGEWMQSTDFALEQINDAAKDAYNLMLRGSSDTLSAAERRTLAEEMDVILKQTVDQGNSSHLGNYIFAGFKVNNPAFTPIDNNADGQYDTVQYNGDSGVILRNIYPGQSITQNVNGTVLEPLYTALIHSRDALNGNNGAAIATALTELQTAMEGVMNVGTTNGARMRQVTVMAERMEKTQLEIKSLLSQKEDINMAEAISTLKYQETVYQSVVEVGKRAVSALNLFEMLG